MKAYAAYNNNHFIRKKNNQNFPTAKKEKKKAANKFCPVFCLQIVEMSWEGFLWKGVSLLIST